MAGSFYRGRRLGQKRLHPGRQGDLQEAEETICVQEWEKLRGEQEAEPLLVHQGRLLMVSVNPLRNIALLLFILVPASVNINTLSRPLPQ